MERLLFYLAAFGTVAGAFSVVLSLKPSRALLAFVFTMFCQSVLYLLAGAYLLAMVNLIVYAGAILVLFLFVIMLQGLHASELPIGKRFSLSHLFLGIVVLIFFGWTLWTKLATAMPRALVPAKGVIENIAPLFFREGILPLELTSLLLLVAVFAAVSLAKKEPSS